jgi:polar amino acid transport system substrate-binding protein
MKKLLTLILTAVLLLTACFSLTACGKDNVTETDDQLAALTEVKAGTSDIAVIDSVMAGYYVNKENFSDLTILTGEEFTFANEYYAIGARKDGNTDECITLALGFLQEQGIIAQIAAKYGLTDVLVPIDDSAVKGMQQPAADTDFGKIMAKGKLVLGYTLFEPIAYMEGNDLIGFDIELAKAVCDLFDIDLECVKINWETKEVELNNGNIDVIWNGFTYTEERAENIDFTSYYLSNRQAIVIRKADAAKYVDYASMKNAKFAAESESAGETTIRNIILPAVNSAK